MQVVTRIAAAACFLLPSLASADQVSVLGLGGFESLVVAHGMEDLTHSGGTLGGLVQVSFTDLMPVDFLVGGGLKYSRLTGKRTEDGMKIEAVISQPMVALEAGVAGALLPNVLSIEGLLGLDIGFLGTDTVKDGESSTKKDIKSFGRWSFQGRAFCHALPSLDVGVGGSYLTGTLQVKGGETLATHGYNISFLARAAL